MDPWRIALAATSASIVLVVVVFWNAFAAMVATWVNTTTYNHGFLIAPIALWLIWRQRSRLAELVPRQDAVALVGMALGALGWLLGKAAEVMIVQQFFAVFMIVATVWFWCGRAVVRRLAFPLFFLFLMVPMGDELIPHLQAFTAWFATGALKLVGIPVFADGFLIETPTGLYEVAEACAGLRFLVANIVVAVLFAHFTYTKRWKVALFLLIAIGLPVIANAIRATGIILIAYATENELAVGVDHLVYGWGFFSVVMLLLLFVGNLFADKPAPRKDPAPPAATGRMGPPRLWLAAAALVLIVAAPLYVAIFMGQDTGPNPPVAALPSLNPTWKRVTATLPPWSPEFRGASRVTAERYSSDAGHVDVILAWYDRQAQGAEVVASENAFTGDDAWTRTATGSSGDLGRAGIPDAMLDRLSGRGKQRAILSWYWVAGRSTGDPFMAKLLQVMATLGAARAEAAVLAISGEADGGQPTALTQFISTMETPDVYLARIAAGGDGH